jgi:hypothetical protein
VWWHGLGLWARVGVVALGVVSTVLVAVFLLKWAPEWLAQPGLTGDKRAEDVGRTRTALLASIAGMIAVTGAVFTGLSYRLNRAGQITDRFSRAIDQLGATDNEGKPKTDVVLGGIYALERIARDSKDDHPQVIEVLTAYVRQHARYEGEEGEPPPLPTDIQAVMSVLARRDITQDRKDQPLHLAGTDLRRLVLDAREGAHLEGAILDEAHLENARLYNAHLEGAWLREAHLVGAILSDAHLQGANLEGAHVSRELYTDFSLALYDYDTVWPTDDFDAGWWGARYVMDDEHRSADTD